MNRAYRFNSTGSVIAEFYIAPEEQNKGYGKALANFAFAQHPGVWEVCVGSGNLGAYGFWETVISETTNGKYKLLSNDFYDGTAFSFSYA